MYLFPPSLRLIWTIHCTQRDHLTRNVEAHRVDFPVLRLESMPLKVLYFGTPDFALAPLEALIRSSHDVVAIVAQPDRPAGRGMKLRPPSVALAAGNHDIPLSQSSGIRTEAFHRWFCDQGAEIAVVVAYGKILPRQLLESLPRGFINVHASLLPSWRGAAPIQRSIEAGDTVTGVSIIQIDEELDHGPVFATREVVIDENDRSPDLAERLSAAGASLLVEVLDGIERGGAEATNQRHDLATYARKIEKEEGRVDWNQSAKKIVDRFRAFWPWPGLFIDIGSERVKLLELSLSLTEGSPGGIVSVEDGLIVGAGEGSIRITEIQRAGRRATSSDEFVHAMNLRQGDSLA